MRVWFGVLPSLLLCVVLRVLLSNAVLHVRLQTYRHYTDMPLDEAIEEISLF
jgi:hypothetical protein